MIKRIIVGHIETNCYIYYKENSDCVIIDPGGDEHKIIAKIQKLNLNPLGIILTHGHLDHTGGIRKLKNLLRKKGKEPAIAIHEGDKQFLGESSAKFNQSLYPSFGVHFENLSNLSNLPKADVFLKEGSDVFGTDLVVIETPGHTPGSICLYSEAEKVLFSGDTLFSGGIGRTDFPGGSEVDLVKNIKEKILPLPVDTQIYPGHGPETLIDWEKGNNPFIA